MFCYKKSLLHFAALLFFTNTITLSVHATENWSILVLGECDESLPATHPAFTTAGDTISQVLSGHGDIKNPDFLNISQNCQSRRDLIKQARKNEKKIDLLVIYKLSLSSQKPRSITKIQMTISAQATDIQSGQIIESANEQGREFSIPASCKKTCLANKLSDYAREISLNLSHELAMKIDHHDRVFNLELIFKDFAKGEQQQISKALRSMAGYEKSEHKLIKTTNESQQLLHTLQTVHYKHQTRWAVGRFREELDNLLPSSLIDGSKRLQVIVHRQGMPYKERYIAALAALIFILYVIYAITRYQHHNTKIQHFKKMKQAEQGKDYIKAINDILIPKLPSWRKQLILFEKDIQQGKELYLQAKTALDKFDYKRSKDLLNQSLSVNQDSKEAATLLNKIADYEKGHTLLDSAMQNLKKQPEIAAHQLKEAGLLNPFLKQKIAPISKQAHDLIRDTIITSRLEEAQKALDADNFYQAISSSDHGLITLNNLNGFVEERENLNRYRTKAISALTPITATVEGAGAAKNLTLFSKNKIDLSRKSNSKTSDIAFKFKRLSSPGKQCQLDYSKGQFTITDLGSSNGTFIESQLMEPHIATALQSPLTQVYLGGKTTPPEQGICRLRLEMPQSAKGALVIRIDQGYIDLLDRSDTAQSWPSMEEDLLQTWAMLQEKLVIYIDNNNQLEYSNLSGSRPACILSYDQGYWIEPAEDLAPDISLNIGDAPLLSKVPLSHRAIISINNTHFSFLSTHQEN